MTPSGERGCSGCSKHKTNNLGDGMSCGRLMITDRQEKGVREFWRLELAKRQFYQKGNFKHQYAKKISIEPIRKKVDGVVYVRLTPALIDWCIGVGQADHESQRGLLNNYFQCEPDVSIRYHTKSWIPHTVLMQLMDLGFAESEKWKLAPVMKWWLKAKRREAEVSATQLYPVAALKKPSTFIDTLNTNSISGGLVKAFRRWKILE